jgi:hypothetical protein
MLRWLRLLRTCLVAVVLSWVSGAAAQDETPDVLFDEGRELWKQGKCDAALPLLRRALEATGSPNARLYVARCLRNLGHEAQAYDELGRTIREASREERYAPTLKQAAEELAQLESTIAKLIIALDESLAGSEVTLNGEAVPAERLGVPMAIEPGKVVVRAGKVVREVVLGAGDTKTVTLAAPGSEPVAAPSSARPSAGPAPSAPDQADPGIGVVRGVGIGVLVLGAGGMVAFGVGTYLADQELGALEEACGDQRCADPAQADTVDRGKRYEIVAGVGLGVGIAGILAGTAMIIFGGPSSDDSAAGLRLAPRGTLGWGTRF